MGLSLKAAAPSIEGGIDNHPMFQHRMVVRKARRQAERDGEQAAALRREIVSGV
jgi:hypothetical protein